LLQSDRPGEAAALLEEACRRRPGSIDLCLFLAQVYQSLGNLPEAQRAAERAARLAPRQARPRLQLAYLWMAAGQEPRAREALAAALGEVDDPLHLLRLLGDLHARSAAAHPDQAPAEADRAIGYYERAAALPTEDDETLLYRQRLGDLYLFAGRAEKALAVFRDLAARQPDDAAIRRRLALCYATLGRKDAAPGLAGALPDRADNADSVPLLDASENLPAPLAGKEGPNRPDSSRPPPELDRLLRCLQSDPELAEQTLRAALDRSPDDPGLIELAVRADLRAGRREASLAKFVRLNALAAAGRSPWPHAGYYQLFGDVAQDLDRADLAAVFYEAAVEAGPDLLAPYLRLAFLKAAEKDEDSALNAIGAAVEARPDDAAAWYVFGLLHLQAGLPKPACGALARAEALASGSHGAPLLLDAFFYFRYGAACERAGQTALAEALLWRAIGMDSEAVEAFNYLAYMWAEQGRNLDLAQVLIEHALDADPENGAYLDTQGWVLFRRRRYEEALDFLLSAAALEPRDPTVLDHLGDVWSALGRPDRAAACWRESLIREPGNAGVVEKLRRLGFDP